MKGSTNRLNKRYLLFRNYAHQIFDQNTHFAYRLKDTAFFSFIFLISSFLYTATTRMTDLTNTNPFPSAAISVR